MYDQIKSSVFVNGKTSNFFGSFRGVRQGENLSPLLFSLFLNDIEDFLFANDCSPLKFNLNLPALDIEKYIRLLVLLYADDTILLANTRCNLQKSLDALKSYCQKWKLEVNPSKTKVVIFHSRKNPRDIFMFDNQKLEVVNSFKYLGIEFSKSGTFFKGKKSAYEQGLKAMYSLLQTARKQKLPIDICLDLYSSMVIPVFLYGCEIWGHKNVEILEKLQLKFLKHLFHLNRKTMSHVIYGETGLYPISVLVKTRMIRFWADIVSSNMQKYSCKLYDILYELHKQRIFTSPWLNCIQNILTETGFECVWDTQSFSSIDSLCRNVRQELQNNYIRIWRNALENSNKCLFYRNFKVDYGREKYILTLPDTYVLSLFQFRCSNHKLPIETGRYNSVPRELRLCRSCDMDVIGDEFHFIMECPKFVDLRNRFVPPKYLKPRSVFNFCNLFKAGRGVCLKLGKFIKLGKVTK